jgi:hypothetical protein
MDPYTPSIPMQNVCAQPFCFIIRSSKITWKANIASDARDMDNPIRIVPAFSFDLLKFIYSEEPARASPATQIATDIHLNAGSFLRNKIVVKTALNTTLAPFMIMANERLMMI